MCYKASLLRGTGQATGEAAFLRGEVTEIKPMGANVLATIRWSEDSTSKALASNLSRVSVRGIADD